MVGVLSHFYSNCQGSSPSLCQPPAPGLRLAHWEPGLCLCPLLAGWKSLESSVHRGIQPPLALSAHQSPLAGTIAIKRLGGVVVPALYNLTV